VVDERLIGERFRALAPELSERGRRIWAASEARAIGRGGIAAVARASGIAPNTIRRGIAEIDAGERLQAGRVRRAGAGRKPVSETDPDLIGALETLVAEDCRGDPMQVLLWTSKSVRKLASELRERGHEAHYTTIAALLRSLGYSLQSNRKTLEGSQHPDRDAQFRYINERVGAAVTAGQPAISIDTKKKELVGEFTNAGREWRPKGKPEKTLTHDFPSDAKGKAIPFGVYDIAANEGSSTSGSRQRPRNWPLPRSARGGMTSAPAATPTPPRCRSPPTAAAATATASGCGSSSCKVSPTTQASRSTSAISRPAPASGTRSSIGCSATSPRTGADDRSQATRS
jgi:hypothetical protein